jgi:hypothetical protein
MVEQDEVANQAPRASLDWMLLWRSGEVRALLRFIWITCALQWNAAMRDVLFCHGCRARGDDMKMADAKSKVDQGAHDHKEMHDLQQESSQVLMLRPPRPPIRQ